MSDPSQAEMIAYLYRREKRRELEELAAFNGRQAAYAAQQQGQSVVNNGLFSAVPYEPVNRPLSGRSISERTASPNVTP